MNSPGKVLARIAIGLAVVIGSFYATLTAIDYFGLLQEEAPRLVMIEEATYGANCGAIVKPGNATQYAAKACDGRTSCDLPVSVQQMGDPANGCAKDFSVRFRCNQLQPRRLYLRGEANGSSLRLDCRKAA
jgi:hypothetical protein